MTEPVSSTFTLTPNGNYILIRDGYFISYRASHPDNPISRVCDILIALAGDEVWDGPETALAVSPSGDPADHTWHNLKGDWREQYSATTSLAEALEVYHRACLYGHRSPHSTDEPPEPSASRTSRH